MASTIKTITRVEIIEVDDDNQSFQSQLNNRLGELAQQYRDQEFGILDVEVQVIPSEWIDLDSQMYAVRRQLEKVRYVGIIKYQFDQPE